MKFNFYIPAQYRYQNESYKDFVIDFENRSGRGLLVTITNKPKKRINKLLAIEKIICMYEQGFIK